MKAVGAGRGFRRWAAWHVAAFVVGAVAAHWAGVTGGWYRPHASARPAPKNVSPTAEPQVRVPADRQVAPQEPALAAATAKAEPEAPAPAAADDPLGNRYRDGMIITGSTPHRLILFTFDDGPDPRTTPLLLDRLDEAGVKAIFFLVASRIAGTTPIERHQAAIAREIARRGHLVGGHTLDHVQLPLLDDAQVEHQLAESDRIFEKALGGRPWLFRPPFGAHSERIDQRLSARRTTPVLWNLGAGDFQVRTSEEVYDIWLKVLERRERENGDRGGIVLLHDTYTWSVDAFERIYAYLQAQNCRLLERGEELYDIVDDLSFFYVPRGDAPAVTEAPRAEPPAAVLAARQAALRESTARRCKSLASAF